MQISFFPSLILFLIPFFRFFYYIWCGYGTASTIRISIQLLNGDVVCIVCRNWLCFVFGRTSDVYVLWGYVIERWVSFHFMWIWKNINMYILYMICCYITGTANEYTVKHVCVFIKWNVARRQKVNWTEPYTRNGTKWDIAEEDVGKELKKRKKWRITKHKWYHIIKSEYNFLHSQAICTSWFSSSFRSTSNSFV